MCRFERLFKVAAQPLCYEQRPIKSLFEITKRGLGRGWLGDCDFNFMD